MHTSLYDLSPLLRVLLMGLVLAAGPLLWVGLRKRRMAPMGRLQALTVVTLFLTFDLVLFGAFTRLTDSGLGCPDWPGCYGSATPLGAHLDIAAAQTAMPTGPVTPAKAWVEMVHRFLATAVGVLITVQTVSAWLLARGQSSAPKPNPWGPTVTLLWVCIQGAFGALTVTMKLFPAIVSLHLLGGYVLLALLTVQTVVWGQEGRRIPVSAALRSWCVWALALLLVQAASGAWVSTNYAVLACNEFPRCQGSWWPSMDFAGGFELWRPLGLGGDGAPIRFEALTAIHYTHRLLAFATVLVLGRLAWYLKAQMGLRKPFLALSALLTLQVLTGLGNVLLDWPLLGAVLHTGGAGALVVVLVGLLAATRGAAPTPTEAYPGHPGVRPERAALPSTESF